MDREYGSWRHGLRCNTNSSPRYSFHMGVQASFRFPSGSAPSWDAIRSAIATSGESPVVRMIDGMPAFPDEAPPDEWKEIRIGLAGAMVTLLRSPGVIEVV